MAGHMAGHMAGRMASHVAGHVAGHVASNPAGAPQRKKNLEIGQVTLSEPFLRPPLCITSSEAASLLETLKALARDIFVDASQKLVHRRRQC